MNKHLLKKIQNSNWLPMSQKILDNLFDNPDYPIMIEQYFKIFQYLAKTANSYELLDVEKLIHLEGTLAEFYSALAKCSTNSKNVQAISDGLKANHDYCSENWKQIFFIDEVLNYIKFGFSLGIKKCNTFNLKESITLEDSAQIFNAWLNCHVELCELIVILEDSLFNRFSHEWERNVFDQNKIQNNSKSQTIKGAIDLIISFSDDLTKYSNSNQKMISACLYNTKSEITYGGRKFGFLYSFSQDSIIAMSPSDAEASTLPYSENDTLIQCLLKGKPTYSERRYLQASQIDLLPIYDYNKFKEKTFKYNEILLKEEVKPYGMLIFREALAQYGIPIITYCISHRLSMFIREKSGDLKYITTNDLYDYLNKVVDLDFL